MQQEKTRENNYIKMYYRCSKYKEYTKNLKIYVLQTQQRKYAVRQNSLRLNTCKLYLLVLRVNSKTITRFGKLIDHLVIFQYHKCIHNLFC